MRKPGNTKVSQLHYAIRPNEYVSWLHVTMHNAVLMRFQQRVSDSSAYRTHLGGTERTPSASRAATERPGTNSKTRYQRPFAENRS
jgi:hypothetical protein